MHCKATIGTDTDQVVLEVVSEYRWSQEQVSLYPPPPPPPPHTHTQGGQGGQGAVAHGPLKKFSMSLQSKIANLSMVTWI